MNNYDKAKLHNAVIDFIKDIDSLSVIQDSSREVARDVKKHLAFHTTEIYNIINKVGGLEVVCSCGSEMEIVQYTPDQDNRYFVNFICPVCKSEIIGSFRKGYRDESY